MVGTSMLVVLLIAITSICDAQIYKSVLFSGLRGTSMSYFENYVIETDVCKKVIPIHTHWWCLHGKSAMEMTVLDHKGYPSIDFDSYLNSATIIRKSGKYDCIGKAKVHVRYSCGKRKNEIYNEIYDWNPKEEGLSIPKEHEQEMQRYPIVPRDGSVQSEQTSKWETRPIQLKVHGRVH